jgi:octaprenyl-diphosphate synthase
MTKASSPFPESILAELEALEPKLVSYLKTRSEPTNRIIAHIIESGGKRFRPGIFLLCCDLLGYHGEHRSPIAAVCEYIHTASLLHDDVIDNSQERRGRPTVNSRWGDETAVLSGDLIYSAACRLMVKTGSLELIDTFAECIRFMSESELFQLELLWKADTSQESYLRVVTGKTAFLFAAACQTPAFLSGQSQEITEALGKFGLSLGMAFQIADDCLDYTARDSAMGKPSVSDIYEGKVTLPLIFALKKASAEQRRFVEDTLEGQRGKTQENQSRIQELVITLGGISAAMELAQGQLNDALSALEVLAASPENGSTRTRSSFDHKVLVHLRHLALFMQGRNS